MTIVDRPDVDELAPSTGAGEDQAAATTTAPAAQRDRAPRVLRGRPTSPGGRAPALDARSADGEPRPVRPRRWLRRSAVVMVLVAIGATLATLQLELGHARTRLDAARNRAAGATAAAQGADAQLTEGAGALTTEEAAAVVAAGDVAAARARLAETDVSEDELREVLDDTQRQLDQTKADQRAAAGRARELEQLRPELGACLGEALRVLSVTALPSLLGPPPPPACAALERARAGGPGR
ncbi:MAG TPA: hypothetical protein VHK88_16995 [Aquihabitans sp.]|nr:hypothetical protein [Aquihabitans sp.]